MAEFDTHRLEQFEHLFKLRKIDVEKGTANEIGTGLGLVICTNTKIQTAKVVWCFYDQIQYHQQQ